MIVRKKLCGRFSELGSTPNWSIDFSGEIGRRSPYEAGERKYNSLTDWNHTPSARRTSCKSKKNKMSYSVNSTYGILYFIVITRGNTLSVGSNPI